MKNFASGAKKMARQADLWGGRAVRVLIRVYQIFVSPTLRALSGTHCRFEPTCSSYMYQAIETHGAAHGIWLGTKRLCRCHPWGGGAGYDPVPPKTELKCE